ncbi:MAG: ABC transporter ATP-binding protein [Burkholderiales bacterium]|nr:ABC transporter ATP-binding protein [Burkholderiales bacterium]
MSAPASSAGVALVDVSVRFDEVLAVDRASVDVAGGEFFTLLGPSGCGKTTLLRAIAGFHRQSAGTIRIGGVLVDDLPAWRRDTGMVFQNYAIFPHLDVRANVAYGLPSRNIRGVDAERRVAETLAMVDLQGLEHRMPRPRSGGQQQRVVIARALAVRPRVLLMDEPLANLDAKLRVRLRNDLKQLQRRLGITTIYVTHDQEEALCLSDRIAVMSAGRILQTGTPEDVYARPAALRVAEFIGDGNFLRGTAEGAPGQATVTLGNGARVDARGPGADLRGEVWLGFRPQDATLRATDRAADDAIAGTLRTRTYAGAQVRYDVDCGLERPVSVHVNAAGAGTLREGVRVELRVSPSAVMLFPGHDADVEL